MSVSNHEAGGREESSGRNASRGPGQWLCGRKTCAVPKGYDLKGTLFEWLRSETFIITFNAFLVAPHVFTFHLHEFSFIV